MDDLSYEKDISHDEIVNELVRELRERQRVYPRWVRSNTHGYTEELAAHRLACLQEAIIMIQHARIRESNETLSTERG